MPVHWGPLSAWTVGAVSVALLALVEYLRRTFVTKEQLRYDGAKLARETDRLEREMAKRLENIERGIETSLVTKEQHKNFGERIGLVEERVTEAKSEAKHAHEKSTQASSDVRFLAQRMEDVVSTAIRELKEQVSELSRQGRSGRQG